MAPRPRQPRHGRDRRRHRPDAERAPPAQVGRVGQRHRDPGRHGGGTAHGHRVDAHHQAAAVGEVPLDQRGQEDVADRDRPADDDRAGEQHRRPVEDAHENARRECRHHPGQHRFDAEPAGQPAARRAQAEAQHRNGGQRCRADARQRKARPQLGRPARPRRPRAAGWSRRAQRTAPTTAGCRLAVAVPRPSAPRSRRVTAQSYPPACPRAVPERSTRRTERFDSPCRNAQELAVPERFNSPCRNAQLACRTLNSGRTGTRSSLRGVPPICWRRPRRRRPGRPSARRGRMVSCSRTYQPS